MPSSKILCGVPSHACNGSNISTKSAGKTKAHTTPKEAMRCMRSHLIASGEYEPSDKFTELKSKNGGPRLVLGSVGSFGLRVRAGKRGENNNGTITRCNIHKSGLDII